MKEILLSREDVKNALEGHINEVLCQGGGHVIESFSVEDDDIRVRFAPPKPKTLTPPQTTAKPTPNRY